MKSPFAIQAAKLQKPRPKLLSKREAKADVRAEDRAENAKVKTRSKGQCEVWAIGSPAYYKGLEFVPAGFWRCRRRAEGEPHHLIYGIGRRNVGRSIKAAHKIATCKRCHSEIHGAVLKPVDELTRYDAATVRFERVK